MHLWPCLDYNLMAFQHHELIQRLFIPNCETEFLSRVIPLNNNTGRDSIVAMMPQCNANGILANWNPPEQSVVEAWLKALNELPEAIESPMVRPPRPAEVEEMKRRLAAVEYSQDTKEDEPLPPEEASSIQATEKAGKETFFCFHFCRQSSREGLGRCCGRRR